MKSKRTLSVALCAALATSLLVIVAGAPRADEREAPGALAYPSCNLLLQQSGGISPFVIAPTTGVFQPIAPVGNVAACSLTVDPIYYSFGRLDLVQWDPATLAPDPTTVVLRTRSFNPSALAYGQTRADFTPPVVTRSVTNVAEAPRQTTAIDWSVTYAYNPHTVRYESDGDPGIPAALRYGAGGPGTPLPGAHPVLSHAVCGGDDALQRLQVIQSVMKTDSLSNPSCYEMIQRFRVPVRSRLHWVEVAFGVRPRPQYVDPMIVILDADGHNVPPTVVPPSLIEAPYAHYVFTPFWGSHYDFDRIITLEPDHDYWLLVRVEGLYYLYSRTLTGGESPDFVANIGPYFRRAKATDDWTQERGQALCFRLIGEPVVSRALPRGRLRERELGEGGPRVPPPPGRAGTIAEPATAVAAREPGPLSVRVAPNPSVGAAFVSWTGAAGTMNVEVLDAQGRRVGGVAGIEGTEGKWMWNGARDDGRPLPAGVYFVRASDGRGRFVSNRVVLIR